MKEYSGRSNIKIYNADCMDFLINCKNNEFDLAIIDPPYNMDINKNSFVSKHKKILKKDGKYHQQKTNYFKSNIDENYINELFRISNNQIIFGANYFNELLPSSSCYLVWHKKNIGNKFSDAELLWTSFNTSIRIFEHVSESINKIHINQKPIQLYKWLLQNYAKKGDKILDTHGGSMSLAIACWDLKFDLTCFEIDKDYYNDAIKRFENHIRQAQIDDNIEIKEAIQKQIF